ncbi:MAG: hypothetical protein VYB05_11085 [Pseudomonadota bacterium]|nr:hypothetical protein [Pseudomonadota bacterium]
MKDVPKPSTTHGRAFGIYHETIAIRWSRSLVEKYSADFEEIAEKIRSRIADEGGGFLASSSIEHLGDEIGFWANPHEASGCHLVNAFLKIPGVLHPVPASADMLKNEGWDLLVEGDELPEPQHELAMPDYENIDSWTIDIPEPDDVRTFVANTKNVKE